MSSLFQHPKSKTWLIDYLHHGKRYRKNTKTTDAKIARLVQKELDVQLAQGAFQQTRQISADAYYEEYLQDTQFRARSTNTREHCEVRRFLKWVKKKTINNITQEEVREYLQRYAVMKPKTFNGARISLRRFFRPAVERKYILENPVVGIKPRPVPQALPRYFTEEQYLQIEKASETTPIYSMIVTARYTGLRLNELLHLEWQDFDWEKKVLTVKNKIEEYGYQTKNRKVRTIPILDELRDKLLPFIKKEGLCFQKFGGGKYEHEGPRRYLRTLFEELGFDRKNRWGFHDFRRSFASHLVQKNVQIYKISKWMGHSSVLVTQIYAHLAPGYDEDIEKLILNGEEVISK